jgi:hypothetical protein
MLSDLKCKNAEAKDRIYAISYQTSFLINEKIFEASSVTVTFGLAIKNQ